MLIIGLGNPGKQYDNTRHNVGFTLLDKLKDDWNFPRFEFNKKFKAEMSEKKMVSFLAKIFPKKEKTILVKPQTFMNLSGEAVRKIMTFYKIPPENIVVIHDDLDIVIGNYKISENSSAGGHNGIQNIIDNIGTQKFNRIRIGVEKKDGRQSRKIPGQKFVLQNFTLEETSLLAIVFEKITLDTILRKKI